MEEIFKTKILKKERWEFIFLGSSTTQGKPKWCHLIFVLHVVNPCISLCFFIFSFFFFFFKFVLFFLFLLFFFF